MRAFYVCDDGRSADLCEYICGNTTRLTIRDCDGHAVLRKEYPSWTAAKNALLETGNWRNSLLA